MRNKTLRSGVIGIGIGIGIAVLFSTAVAFAGNISPASGPMGPGSQAFTQQGTQVRLESGAADAKTFPFSAPAASPSALQATSCYATADNGGQVFSSADAHAVQEAVDAASDGGVVKVAGTCLGVESRAGTLQSAYISKTLTLSGGYTTTNWTASYPITQPTVIDAAGGGRVLYATMALTVSDLTLQHGNSSVNDGGGVYAGAVLALSNVQVLSNTGGYRGGGANALGAVTAVDSRFENNTANFGGGVYTWDAMTVVDSHFENNIANTDGGGLYAWSALNLINTKFLSNTANFSGGGALAFGPVTAVDSHFANNTAGTIGGGLYVNFTLSLTNTHFLSNTAGQIGGGARATGAVTAADCRFENNTANNYGGGLAADSTLSLTNTHFLSNTAGNIGGGALVIGPVTAVHSHFENNRANQLSGGGLLVGSTLSLTETHFLSNTAGSQGGGVHAMGAVTAVDSHFENNNANDRGGGLFAESTLSLTNTHFLGNRADGTGGGAWVGHYGGGASRIVNGLFVRNHAGNGLGDALYLVDTNFTASGTAEVLYTTITSPTLATGAAIVAGQGTVTIADSIITSHTIGIQQSGSSVVSQDHNLFYGNTFNISGAVSSAGSLVGNPAFVDPATDDYHLSAASAAINLGVNVGVISDFEGDPRPFGGGFDAGYDESPFTSTAMSCYATADNGWPVFGSADAHAVQQAVDAASAGDVVKVAGTCVGVENRDGTLQSVYIPITLTLSGSYTTTNWTTSYPITQPTVIDAAGGGRVISATLALTVSNLTLQHGNSSGNGGGVYAGAVLALSNVQVLSNTGFYGGGAWISGTVTAVDSRFENNHSPNSGGGGVWANTTLSLINTDFLSNTADHYAGGAFAWGAATAVDSRFENNRAGASGGGLRVWSTLNMTNTHFLNNTANQFGGGAYVVQYHGGVSRIVNSLFAGNYSAYGSDALHLFHPTYGNSRVAEVLHTTFANPTLSSGEAIVAITNEAIGPGTVMITDCIISNYAVGIEQGGNSVVSQDHNLFYGNTIDITGTVSGGVHSLVGNPAFVDPATDDYHLTAASAAIDLGANVGVTSDFENDPRPQGGGFDAGYDESPFTSTVTSCYGAGIVTNTNTSETFCSIQAAIDDSDTLNGHVIAVTAGLYAENVAVTKGVDLRGPNYGISPNGGVRVAEAIVVPATDDITGGVVFSVAASNVSINGFTIDGDNTLLTNGYTSTTSADINAAEGVAVYVDNVNNLSVSKNILQNLSFFGVTLFGASYSAPATTGHLVEDNLFRDLGTYAPGSGIAYWGGGVLLYNNQYARVTNNRMNNVRSGVQTGNFSQANPGTATYQVIDGNSMSVRRRGIFHNLHYGPTSPYTLSNNTITALANPHETVWDGILLASLSVPSTSTNNVIDGSAVSNPSEGYEVWNVKISTPAVISGGSVRGVRIGLFVNNFEGYNSDAGDGAYAVVSSIRITPTANGVGVRVLDSPSSSHFPVSVTVKDDCEIVQTGQTGAGVVVEGGGASASVQDNDASIHGFAIGIDVNGSAANITNDHIYDNGVGIRVTNAGTATITGNTIGPNTTGVLVENGAAATLTCNNIAGNTSYGVNNTTSVMVNAEGNWWGALSGPFHSSNPAGAGDAVSDNVDFTPWTTAAAPGGCTALAATSTTGHFYLGATGAIIPGGSIGVSGPNTITIAQNGTTGVYQWLTSGAAGQYTLAVTPPPGYVLSPACPAQAGSLDPTGSPSPLILGAGEAGNTGVLSNSTCGANQFYLSFALAQADPLILNNNLPLQGTASIGDRVWNDLNKDGVQDGGEPGIAGVTLNLYTVGGVTPIATTTTDASGVYTFSSIYSSTFHIQIDIPEFFPSGTLFGFAASPTGAQSVTDPQTFDYTVTVSAGQAVTNVDFGLYGSGKSTLGKYVWRDLNGNGQHSEANEVEYVAGINGVRINVYRDDGDLGFDPDPTGANGDMLYATTVTTGANAGFYSVDVVAFGKAYWVEVTASNFTAGGPLFGLTTTNTANPNLNRQLVQMSNDPLVPQYTDDSMDFGYASSDYALEKSLRTPPVAGIGGTVRFAIRITNTGQLPLTQIPLTDTYNTNFLLFVSGAPAPDSNADDGVINWSNVLTTPLNAGAAIEVQIVFLAGFDTTWLGPGGTINVAETNNVIASASLGGPPIKLGYLRDEASVVILAPTAVAVLRLSAETLDGATHVIWETAEESNIAGFALSRHGADGVWTPLNTSMIPAQASGQPRGATYLFVDDAPSDADTLYRLDAITLDQKVIELGVVAPINVGARLFLPVVVK